MGAAAVARYGAPYLHLHRADLLGILRQAVERAGVQLRLGAEVAHYEGRGHQVLVSLAGGDRIEADLLVGADGIRSTIRQQMLGKDSPRYTGSVAWRLLTPASAAPDLPRGAIVWAGPGRHAVTYRIRGDAWINFVGVIEDGGQPLSPGSENWDEHGELAALQRAFAGWADPLPAIIASGGVCRRWPLFDRDPLSRWVDGRVVLLGDACHPLAPFQAQGAAMAIEDGFVLARCLDEAADEPETALVRYQTLRRPRTDRMLKSARANMAIFHQANPLTRAATYGPMMLADRLWPAVVRSRQDWIYGYDVTGQTSVVG